jgi:hypothetical protein
MSVIRLPFTNDAYQSFTVQLDDFKFFIEAKFNSRSNVWTMNLYNDATREPHFVGVPLLLGVDLLDAYNFPFGAFVVIDDADQGREATSETLGDSVNVYWVSADEEFTTV